MPDRKIMEMMAENRRKQRPQAERVYQQYAAQVPQLIRQLAGPTQAKHNRAFELLRQMGECAAAELLEALVDPTLDPMAVDEVASLLGTIGYERARDPMWQILQSNLDDADRVSSLALSLSGLGDERSLPYLRTGLRSDTAEHVSNAAAGMVMVGKVDDVPRLRQAHRRYRSDPEVRMMVAQAVLMIVGRGNARTFNRTLDDIHHSFADRHLWDDIWSILEAQFGNKPSMH